MADILHRLPIRAGADAVFAAVSTAPGLDRWWTARSSGVPGLGNEYSLWFGPGYDWRARVSACQVNRHFELTLTDAMPDWLGSVVGFRLEPGDGTTVLEFSHQGWPEISEHYRVSNCCWAMYLRVLRRALEYGEDVPYEQRLEV